MRQRQTLAKELSFSGVGLHSGKTAQVHLLPCKRSGIYFHTSSGKGRLREAQVAETSRLTALRFPDGSEVRTVEHLLAALYTLGVDDAEIHLEGEEIPILDGSAHLFAEAIQSCGLVRNEEILKEEYLMLPVSIVAGNKSIVAMPSREFRISYMIDYSGTAIGLQAMTLAITPESFMNRLSRARTFGLEREVAQLRQMGLALGGSLDNALIFNDTTLLNESGLRFPDECIAHKTVDLLGDLARLERRVIAHYVVICGGHDLHAALVDRMRTLFGTIGL